LKSIVLGIALAAGVLGSVIYLRGGVVQRDAGAEPMKKAHVEVKRRYAPETVLDITPHAAVEKTASGRELSPRGSPLVQEYRAARQYAALAARLDGKSPRSPEENWLLAEILEQCGFAAAARAPRPKEDPRPTREDMVRNFVSSLSEKDPHRDKRIAAYTTRIADRCDGVRAPRPNEPHALRQAAAAQGEIKARIRLARDDTFAPSAKTGLWQPDVAKHEGVVRAALESGEPYAIQVAAGLLEYPHGNLTALVGANDMPVVEGVFRRAALALSCELGADCGPGSQSLMTACADHGACDVRDLREYYFFYGLSPHQSQLMNEYVEALRNVVRSRDWSRIRLATRVPRHSATVMP